MKCTKCGNDVLDKEFCEHCGAPVGKPAGKQAVAVAETGKKENVFTGIIGAMLGAVLGGGCIILLSQLGYVASVSGLVLAFCTLKGYELLGRKLSKKGVIICILLVLVTPYIADRLDWAIVVMQEFSDYNITLLEAFAGIPALISEGVIDSGDYIKNLLMIYGFAALGAFSTLRNSVEK